MPQTYPHPCTHCGLCCIAEVCPVGMRLMRVEKKGPCPALEWDEKDENKSRCGLLAHPEKYVPASALPAVLNAPMLEIMGAGKGCCMAARVIGRNGTALDFASLPADAKTQLVLAYRHANG